jgi:hypothetical protein
MVAPPVIATPLNQRQLDERQLGAFVNEYQHTNLADRHARRTLSTIAKHVEAFRQSLYQHNYNAMDILRESDNLEHSIHEQIAKLPKHGPDHVLVPEVSPQQMVVPAPVTTLPPPQIIATPPVPGSPPQMPVYPQQ